MSYIVMLNNGIVMLNDGYESHMIDYSWLKDGCIDDTYFNWMFNMWTVQDDNIRFIVDNNTAYRKFISCGFEGLKDNKDRESHYKRFQLISNNEWLTGQINHDYYNSKHGEWLKQVQWIELPH